MRAGTFQKLNGTIESDQTSIGGASKNMPKDVRAVRAPPRCGRRSLPTPTRPASTPRSPSPPPLARRLTPDSLLAYKRLDKAIWWHEMVDHAVQYVPGTVHTSGLENFWSLLKRTIEGTYVSVRAKHLRPQCWSILPRDRGNI